MQSIAEATVAEGPFINLKEDKLSLPLASLEENQFSSELIQFKVEEELS